MPLLSYLAANSGRPGDAQAVAQFRKLADKADPRLRDPSHAGYVAARELVRHFMTLDPETHKVTMREANKAILQPIRQAVKNGTATEALAAIKEHGLRLADLHGVPVPQSLRTGGRAYGQRPSARSLVEKLKKGAKVDQGTTRPGADDVEVNLSKGEMVVNKKATDKFGPELDRMNAWGNRLQGGFATSAPVFSRHRAEGAPGDTRDIHGRPDYRGRAGGMSVRGPRGK